MGNICTLLEEPVLTKYAGYIKAYLVEARSVAGLSGSPVIVLSDPTVLSARILLTGKLEKQPCALLGLMHGHFDVQNLNEDVVSDDDDPKQSVHTGIGIVVPVEKIIETIRHPELMSIRKAIVQKLRKSGATPDIIPDDGPLEAKAPNLHHREDFTALLNAATRKPQSKD